MNAETPHLPSPPESVRGLCSPERLPLMEQYAQLLATEAVTRGLIGPREVPRLWERHIANSAILSSVLPEDSTVCDIGSGAGLPGLVVAITRPDLRVTLVEPLLRRTVFLDEVVETLGLNNVEVVRGRADVLHEVRTFDVVTSRAVAPLERLLGWSMPLVAAQGALIALKGSSIGEEVEVARPVLDDLRCAEPEILTLGEGVLESVTHAVRVSWADPSAIPLHRNKNKAMKKPRRTGGKRPTKGRDRWSATERAGDKRKRPTA